jgi:hypothetical protein
MSTKLAFFDTLWQRVDAIDNGDRYIINRKSDYYRLLHRND